jgi:aerobic-type carbon monoxide dehydrogenase small subunit (CoxS/CutS family)
MQHSTINDQQHALNVADAMPLQWVQRNASRLTASL